MLSSMPASIGNQVGVVHMGGYVVLNSETVFIVSIIDCIRDNIYVHQLGLAAKLLMTRYYSRNNRV